VNFIAHAYVARLYRTDTAYVLGAMLPDFFGMARIHGAQSDNVDVAAGVAFHHATDETFHRTPAFITLQAAFFAELRASGVARGPARAVAHVGLELLLDGFLVGEPGLPEAYLAAVEAMAPTRLGSQLRFARDGHRERYATLTERLGQWGVPRGYGDPAAVRDRLVRILEGRPRLALGPSDVTTLSEFLPAAQRAVGESLEKLLGPVRAAAEAAAIG